MLQAFQEQWITDSVERFRKSTKTQAEGVSESSASLTVAVGSSIASQVDRSSRLSPDLHTCIHTRNTAKFILITFPFGFGVVGKNVVAGLAGMKLYRRLSKLEFHNNRECTSHNFYSSPWNNE